MPVDFSPAAAAAYRYAAAIGTAFRATVDLFHVWHTSTTKSVTASRAGARQALRDFVASNKVRGDITVRRKDEYGDPYMTILNVSSLSRYDAIIVGVTASDGRKKTAVGLVERLIRTSRCPIVVVSGREPIGGPGAQADEELVIERCLVVANREDGPHAAIEYAASLAKGLSACLDIAWLEQAPSGVPVAPADMPRGADQEGTFATLRAALSKNGDRDYGLIVMSSSLREQADGDSSDFARWLVEQKTCPVLLLPSAVSPVSSAGAGGGD